MHEPLSKAGALNTVAKLPERLVRELERHLELELRVPGFGCRVQGLGFRVQSLGRVGEASRSEIAESPPAVPFGKRGGRSAAEVHCKGLRLAPRMKSL